LKVDKLAVLLSYLRPIASFFLACALNSVVVILYNSPPLQISVIPPMTLKEKVLANNMVNIFIFFILRIISNYTMFFA
jgi:hypothetical protein